MHMSEPGEGSAETCGGDQLLPPPVPGADLSGCRSDRAGEGSTAGPNQSGSSGDGVTMPPAVPPARIMAIGPQSRQASRGAAVPAWAASFLVHVIVLLGLSLAALEPAPPVRPLITLEEPPPDPFEEIVFEPEEVAVADEASERVGAQSEGGLEMAAAAAAVLDQVSAIPIDPETEIASDIFIEQVAFEMLGPLVVEQLVMPVIGTNVGQATTGAAGAVDRLTIEIARSMEEAPTLVCWLFDQSVSLQAQRQEIAARLERVFHELGPEARSGEDSRLAHMVIGYGARVAAVTDQPTDSAASVVEAIRSIPIDDSGLEMTFSAIQLAANRMHDYRMGGRRSNVMIIVFSDEVGNDQEKADQTTLLCRRHDIPVHVVGVPAPFGMREVAMRFVEFDSRFASAEEWAVVEQGPESLYPEVVQIDAGRLGEAAIDSGFGPFALSKLCAETGGVYFAVHPNRGSEGGAVKGMIAPMSSRLRRFFDPEIMRDYQPDYLSVAKIDQMLSGNRAKRALVEAAAMTDITPMAAPRMVFPRESDAAFAGLLTEAQKTAAILEPRIDRLYATLENGRHDRQKIREKRWQAGFDLAIGRSAALKVRTDAYNQMLAKAKTGMKFTEPGSDTWELVPSETVVAGAVGAATMKLARQASETLERVVREHPGTPWAFVAQSELDVPLGYRWQERHTGINDPKPTMRAPGNVVPPRPGVPRDDMQRKLAPPKPKRDLKKI